MYKHIVQYYETDKMGITHHSNYIRWMEEARIYFLKENGWDYVKLEDMGIVSPVLETNCKYKQSTTFADEILINVTVKEFKGVKLFLHYQMNKVTGELVAEADSVHCFLTRDGKPINIARQYPELYKTLVSLIVIKSE